MDKLKAKSVNDYLTKVKEVKPEAASLLEQLKGIIVETKPKYVEEIKYGLPYYTYDKNFIGIAAFKNHVSLQISQDLSLAVKQEAKKLGYQTGQKRLNVTFEQQIPTQVVKEILELLV